MLVQSYRDLETWQVAMELVERIYALTKQFPHEELYGLTSQLRRAGMAIPSNVSEGHQHGTKAYVHFITMALGSLAEVETQLELARRLRLAPHDHITSISARAAKLRCLLHGLRRSLTAERN
jgi:four helix bundle protein